LIGLFNLYRQPFTATVLPRSAAFPLFTTHKPHCRCIQHVEGVSFFPQRRRKLLCVVLVDSFDPPPVSSWSAVGGDRHATSRASSALSSVEHRMQLYAEKMSRWVWHTQNYPRMQLAYFNTFH